MKWQTTEILTREMQRKAENLSSDARKTTKTAAALLQSDLKRIQENPNEFFSVGTPKSIYEWEIAIFGPSGTPYEGGIFKANMVFPLTFPHDPPKFTFCCNMFHPNIHPNTNEVCISILHKGKDEFGYESDSERWLPVREPESIILSILSLLCEPNCESPADVDAAVAYTKDKNEYWRKIRKIARKTVDQ